MFSIILTRSSPGSKRNSSYLAKSMLTISQVSTGTVWTVGGLAPPSVAIPDGRGRLISSGTNAPLYTTSFSSSKPKIEEDRERHEGRLARALDLDRCQRIYDFKHPESPSEARSIRLKKRRNMNLDNQTTWKGTEWVKEGKQRSLFTYTKYPTF